MDASVFERFLSLAKRELAAEDVRLLEPGESAPDAPNVVVARLPDGRHVVASFPEAPKDASALARRLAMLANTFAEALATPPSERTRARPHVVSSLHEELKALAARARAVDVVVIDVDSPVVWGCASTPTRPRARSELFLREVLDGEFATSETAEVPPAQDVVPAESAAVLSSRIAPPTTDGPAAAGIEAVSGGPDEAPSTGGTEGSEVAEPEATRRAIAAVRRLPTLDHLHKGRHLRHVSQEGAPYLVLSFSAIYLLCLVFDDTFDELRAERAAQESLARIERLVLALPPLDPEPEPMGGVIALRRRRR